MTVTKCIHRARLFQFQDVDSMDIPGRVCGKTHESKIYNFRPQLNLVSPVSRI